MEKNKLHNEEEKEFEKIQNLLKDLPKVKAPDNFEFNLLTRIHNKNFDLKTEKKNNLFRIYAPSFALAASVALVFFLFSDKDIEESKVQKIVGNAKLVIHSVGKINIKNRKNKNDRDYFQETGPH